MASGASRMCAFIMRRSVWSQLWSLWQVWQVLFLDTLTSSRTEIQSQAFLHGQQAAWLPEKVGKPRWTSALRPLHPFKGASINRLA